MPQPLWVPIVVCAAVAAAVFGAAASGGLHGSMLVVAPVSFALFGVFLAIDRWITGHRLRNEADAWIGRGYESAGSRYAWRVAELTSARERTILAASMHGVVAELDAPRRSPAVPLARGALRSHRDLVAAIADRLGRMDRPVAAGGVVAVNRLLTQPDSCLYTPVAYGGRIPRAEAELSEVLDRLEVHS